MFVVSGAPAPENSKMEVIRFADNVENFPLGNDITADYTITKPDVALSCHDWIGLYKEGWSHTRQYVAFEWAPSEPQDSESAGRRRRQNRRRRRQVIFPASSIEEIPPNSIYQFVYVNRRDEVLGQSRIFVIGDKSFSSTSSSIVNIASPDCVPSTPSTSDHSQKGLLGGFEVLSSEPEEELVIVDHVDVVKSMDHMDHLGDYLNMLEEAIAWESPDNESKEMALVHVRHEDRALVKVNTQTKALVPYRHFDKTNPFLIYAAKADQEAKTKENNKKFKKAKKNPFDMTAVATCLTKEQYLASQAQVSAPPSPQSSSVDIEAPASAIPVASVSPMVVMKSETGPKVKHVVKCRRCRQFQTRLRKAEAEKEATLEKMKTAEQSNQENQEVQTKLMSARLRNLTRENKRLVDQHAKFCEELKAMHQDELEIITKDRDMFQKLKDQFETDTEELRHQNEEVNHQLDDILYSLSMLGFTGIKETNGKILDLSIIPEEPGREPLSAEGWKVARSKREERLLAGLKIKQKQTVLLKEQCQQLEESQVSAKKSREEINKQLQGEKESVEMLQKSMVQMDGQVFDLKQHVIVLKDMLAKEEKRNAAALEQSQIKEVEMQAQITQLTFQLKEAKPRKPSLFSTGPIMCVDIPSTSDSSAPKEKRSKTEVVEQQLVCSSPLDALLWFLMTPLSSLLPGLQTQLPRRIKTFLRLPQTQSSLFPRPACSATIPPMTPTWAPNQRN